MTLDPFFIGRYPITQAQWQEVASWDPGTLDPDPSRFKGADRPVERVSWDNAVTFCQRLSLKTSPRLYRLPSEAEWEYACRAGSVTPFYFGETLTSDLANYGGTNTYAQGPKGQYRKQTTPVGQFPANAFGLHDMHGNVWEWCQDDWHNSYDGSPTDGSAWEGKDSSTTKVVRGGSWFNSPRLCRSASRFRYSRDFRYNAGGFRVVCVSSRSS